MEKITLSGEALSALALDLFKVNNRLLSAGDKLVAELGLTSARWQVLGSIVASESKLSVAWLARSMGGSRQNIQRIVNDLVKEGLVEFIDNPHHRKASLVSITEKGKATFDSAMTLEIPWMNRLTAGIPQEELISMHNVLKKLWIRLEEEY